MIKLPAYIEANLAKYARDSVAIVGSLAFIPWILQGFDSGIGAYGTSMHWSVFPIYAYAYYFTSRHYEKLGVIGFQNWVYSFVITVFSLAVFEWYWMINYALFHGKYWILGAANWHHVIPNSLLTLAGLYILRHVKDRISPSFLIIAILLIPAWYWMCIGFPQTCYPQLDGAVTYVENNKVHLVNLLAKIGVTGAVMEVFRVE